MSAVTHRRAALAENAPMLHINETLGYVRRPGFVEHHKRVRESGA